MKKITSLSDVKEGQEIPTFQIAVDTLMMVKYSGASDDYARVHWDHPYMIEQGFPGVVTQGWLTMAHMTQAVTNWIPQEIADVRTYAVRYHKPGRPGLMTYGGDVVRVSNEGSKRIVDLKLWAKNEEGVVTTSATMTLASP